MAEVSDKIDKFLREQTNTDADQTALRASLGINTTPETIIADPTAGATIDAEARTAINEIIDALQNHKIVATS